MAARGRTIALPAAALLLWAASSGRSAPTRDLKGEKALRAAAESGDARAEYGLGRLIASRGDPAGLAARWYRKAAEQGEPDAKRALSDLQASRGPGPRKGRAALERAKECAKARKASDPECDRLFLAAANEGSAEAQCAVGKARIGTVSAAEFYDSVHDLPEKLESKKKPGAVEGAGWLKTSAEQGFPEAQFLLGGLLEAGTYLDRDPKQAVLWYRRAADQGLAKAAEAEERLENAAKQESQGGDSVRARALFNIDR